MKQNESLWLGVGIGCALLLLCTLCILGAAAAFLIRSRESPPITPALPAPTTPTVPGTPPVVGPAQPAIPSTPSGDVRQLRATITEVTGLSDVAAGAPCTAEVSRHDREDGTFWCNAQVRCGGRLVYGGLGAGFFECVLYAGEQRDVVGSDQRTSAEDNDGALSLNTVGGSLEVWDDEHGSVGAFRIRARIDGVE